MRMRTTRLKSYAAVDDKWRRLDRRRALMSTRCRKAWKTTSPPNEVRS
jgi:hypothetical protein